MQRGLLWPIRPKPYPDELLSSWLARLAWANGEKLQSFCFKNWGRARQVFCGDPDRYASDEFLVRLSESSGTPLGAVRATCLGSYAELVFVSLPQYGPIPWVMPLGTRGTARRARGLQICPQCIADDQEAYFRKKWRLACITCCTKHGRYLLDYCQGCGASLTPHRGDVGSFSLPLENPMTFCAICHTDFHLAGVSKMAPAPLVDLQQTIELGLERGGINIGGRYVHTMLFMEGIRTLFRYLLLGHRSQRLWSWLNRQTGFDATLSPDKRTGGQSEQFPIETRAAAMYAISWLLQDFPECLVRSLRSAGVSSSYILECSTFGARQVPFWLWEPVHIETSREWYALTDEEIFSAYTYLSAKHRVVTKGLLAKTLGVSWINRRTIKKLFC